MFQCAYFVCTFYCTSDEFGENYVKRARKLPTNFKFRQLSLSGHAKL